MRIDLKNPFDEGMATLNNWRNRYPKSEYPFKIVLNIFYRQYTMNSIWDSQISNSFDKFSNTSKDNFEAFQSLENFYSDAAQNLLSATR